MIKRGDKLSADKLNKTAKWSNTKLYPSGGSKVVTSNDPVLNDIVVAGGGGGGGGITIKYVAKLPKIESNWKRPRFVFWCDEATGQAKLGEPGTGDNQVWAWYPNAPYFVPLQKYTTKSGIPEGNVQ